MNQYLNRTTITSLGLAAALALVAAPSQVLAQQSKVDTIYVGLDVHGWRFNPDRGSSWSDIGIRGRAGYQFLDQIAAEVHLATGGSDRANGVRLEMDLLAGVFLRGDIPLSRYFSLYGLLGVSYLDYTVARSSEDETSISFGLGADYQLTGNTYLSADYIRYVNDSDFDYDAFNVGARWRF